MRETFTVIHRWGGLFIAVFLLVAGLTGAVISWDHALDEWLNPHLFDAKTTGAPLSPHELVRRVEASDSESRCPSFRCMFEAGHNASLFVEPRVNPLDRRALRGSPTIRSSSIRRAARWPAGASGAPSRWIARTFCRFSTSCTTRCTFHPSGASIAGASGSWGSSDRLDVRLLRRLLPDAAAAGRPERQRAQMARLLQSRRGAHGGSAGNPPGRSSVEPAATALIWICTGPLACGCGWRCSSSPSHPFR